MALLSLSVWEERTQRLSLRGCQVTWFGLCPGLEAPQGTKERIEEGRSLVNTYCVPRLNTKEKEITLFALQIRTLQSKVTPSSSKKHWSKANSACPSDPDRSLWRQPYSSFLLCDLERITNRRLAFGSSSVKRTLTPGSVR